MSSDSYIEGDVPHRTISNGIFPFSPRANAREGIFSDVLAAVMGCDPNVEFQDGFQQSFQDLEIDGITLENDASAEDLWEVYLEKYTTETGGGSPIAVPFNVEVPMRIEPTTSMQWGTWYQLLMTTGEPGDLSFAKELHQDFKERLESQDASNIFEELVLEVVGELEDPDQKAWESPEPLRPYIPAAAENFTRDLRAWLNNKIESSSDWLRDCQDLIGIHFFMYYIQVGLNLRQEWEVFTDESTSERYSPEMVPVPFGIESERAGMGREFVTSWEGERGASFSVKNDIFDSFAKL